MKQVRREALQTMAAALGATWTMTPGECDEGLKAGAAAVKITPALDRPVYLAGYSANRRATGVHDDVWARALVLERDGVRIAIVACDLIGLLHERVDLIRQPLESVPPANVLIACTHVHSGPDTLGLWGPGPLSSGVDRVYMEELGEKVRTAVDQAVTRLMPAALYAGRKPVEPGLVYNSREPVQDHDLTVLRFAGHDDRTIASVIHYGAHPEVIKTDPEITSDFVHPVRAAVEKRFGGTSLYINGALGGMVTPDVRGRHNWEEMERVGDGIGAVAIAALDEARSLPVSRIRMLSRPLTLQVDNQRLRLAAAAGLLDLQNRRLDKAPTEICRLDIGAVSMLTVPGEILPRPALALKAEMPGSYPMVVALGNDELGYILDPDDFERDLYAYERSMSIARGAWPAIHETARGLLKE